VGFFSLVITTAVHDTAEKSATIRNGRQIYNCFMVLSKLVAESFLTTFINT